MLEQDPGAQQDAEAAREKLLKAEDQLDNIQANSETTKTAVDGMKADLAQFQAQLTQLQTDNAALHQQVADLQAALAAEKAEQARARQTLIDNVADMIAAGKTSKPAKKKHVEPAADASTDDAGPVHAPSMASSSAPASDLAPPPDPSQPAPSISSADDNINPPPKPQKGYYHVVASGETLRLICEAYRENGVNTSVSAIRKANGLTPDSVLKTGQKIFIPKPGT